MATRWRVHTITGRFTILSDGTQGRYEIVECEHGPEGVVELNHRFPPSAGWMIVDCSDTMEDAELIIQQHRGEARRDFE